MGMRWYMGDGLAIFRILLRELQVIGASHTGITQPDVPPGGCRPARSPMRGRFAPRLDLPHNRKGTNEY